MWLTVIEMNMIGKVFDLKGFTWLRKMEVVIRLIMVVIIVVMISPAMFQ